MKQWGIESKLETVNETAENTENTVHAVQREFRYGTQKNKEELFQIKKEIETLRVYDAQTQDESIRSGLTENKTEIGRNTSGIKQNSSLIRELKTKLYNLEIRQHKEKYNEQSKASVQ